MDAFGANVGGQPIPTIISREYEEFPADEAHPENHRRPTRGEARPEVQGGPRGPSSHPNFTPLVNILRLL